MCKHKHPALQESKPRLFRQLSYGFTLVELLVVIAILALIASIAGPQVMKQFSDAKADAATLQIKDFGASLDLFYLDIGRYPTTSEGLNALLNEPGSLSNWSGPYLRSPTVPDDPWGNPYEYKSPSDGKPFLITSLGADGAEGGEDDNTDIYSE